MRFFCAWLMLLLGSAACSGTEAPRLGVAPGELSCPPPRGLVYAQTADDLERVRAVLEERKLQSLGDSLVPVSQRGLPRIVNFSDVRREWERSYPAIFTDQGIGGVVSVAFYVDQTGHVEHALVERSSGYEDLDQSAINMIRIARFEPIRLKGCSAGYWAVMPVAFQIKDDPTFSGHR